MPTLKSNKIIGITMGDPAGIGPEIIAKALDKKSIRNLAEFVVIGDYSIYSRYATDASKHCTFLDINTPNAKNIKTGKESIASGAASLQYLQTAVDLLKKKKINALVTAPVSKESICRVTPSFTGHTEFLAEAFKVKKEGMLFVAGKLRMIIVTRHMPLNQVSKNITKDKVYQTIALTYAALRNIFKIRNPKMAICGLNPHAGEGGTIGDEEIKQIIPAINKAKKQKINITGPFPADTIFTTNISDKFDVVIAMYHDQGLVGIKTMCFHQLVNMTIGLPFIRTSPAHGTAFNIAGKDIADASSIIESIKLAAQ